jgi:frataxin-like iron-binding protein CyaY
LSQVIINADKKYTPVDLANENLVINRKTEEQIKQKWATKPIHGKHYRDLNNKYVDKESSNKWLVSCNLFRETEELMIAIQDGVLPKRNYQKHTIKKADVKDECRKCGKEGEMIEHIISGCKIMAKQEYLLRHNSIAEVVHQELAHRTQ